jgi:hypothetical protein
MSNLKRNNNNPMGTTDAKIHLPLVDRDLLSRKTMTKSIMAE